MNIYEPMQPFAPPVAATWPAFDFYRKFTSTERIRARALASVDPVADDIMRTLDAAIASGSNVRADDPDTINGLNYLSAYGPADGNGAVLAAGRAAEILA